MTVHVYVSTACLHGEHKKCRETCKYCGDPCECSGCDHSEIEAHPLDVLKAELRDVRHDLDHVTHERDRAVKDRDWAREERDMALTELASTGIGEYVVANQDLAKRLGLAEDELEQMRSTTVPRALYDSLKTLRDEAREQVQALQQQISELEWVGEHRTGWIENPLRQQVQVLQDRIAKVREICEDNRAESTDGDRTDVDTIWPSEILAVLDGVPETPEPALETLSQATIDSVYAIADMPVRSVHVELADDEEEHPERICRRCGGPNVKAWCAPSPLWNQVMRGGDINGKDIHDGIVCPVCFAALAEEAGIAWRWRFYADRVLVPLQTVTPSGRRWNERTWSVGASPRLTRTVLPVSSGAASVEVNTQGEGQNGRQLAWMRDQLSRRRFRDWKLSLISGTERQAHLVIVYTEPDSYTGIRREFKVIGRINHTEDSDRFHHDVTNALKQAWDHEFDEHNQLDGKPINDPHQDPDRWHCFCGCLGPKRAGSPTWTCTKCGMVQHAPVKSEES